MKKREQEVNPYPLDIPLEEEEEQERLLLLSPLFKGVGGLPSAEKFGLHGFKFPINKSLSERAKEMAKNMTKAERKAWFDILKNTNYKWVKQKVIDNYIVDFYCHELGLAVEIDGQSHNEKQEYDAIRSEFLKCFNLKVLRYLNEDVLKNAIAVFEQLNEEIKKREKEINPCPSDIPLEGEQEKLLLLSSPPF